MSEGHYVFEEVLEYSVLDILSDYGRRFREFLPRIYRIYHSHINRHMRHSFHKSGRPIVLAKNVPKVLDKYHLDYRVEKGRRVDYLIKLKAEDVQRLEQAKASLRNELLMALR